MIRLHDHEGRSIFLAPDAVAKITEAGTSSQWHGIRSYVKTFDGEVLEVGESSHEIALMLEKARGGPQ